MLQSKLFSKVSKEFPKDEESVNARYLTRGGFIYKNSAGVFSYLPLGWRVMQKIAAIIREEMNAVGGEELFMPALHDKKYLMATNRWDVDVVYKVITGEDKEPHYNISWTHEEIAAEIASRFVNSYQDLPFAFYQIQTKFRHEPRAKSGLLRSREFMMKDLYSFHTTEEDLFKYYDVVKEAYFKVFNRVGLKSFYTLAAGGEFTVSNTHEFQVVSPVGEDTVFVCDPSTDGCGYAENSEISKLKDGGKCPQCGGKIKEEKSIEVGNIFPLGTKYSEAFNLRFTNEKGEKLPVVMGSYGIGLGRVMGTVAEVYHDERGVIWPESIAPFRVHLIALAGKENSGTFMAARQIYDALQNAGIEVLYDDREGASPGEKFAEADMIGIPYRVVVSERNGEKLEVKKRSEADSQLIDLEKLITTLARS